MQWLYFHTNNVVYITIPNGDYDNDKIITGKKIKRTTNGSLDEPFIYTPAFNSFVDVSGNLIEEEG